MKIEKLNENQIRCTLTHADLAARHLKLSELAYGTEKAKSLFRDMMQQASFDFGFEAENIPHYKLVCGQRISKEKGRRFNDQSNRKAPTLLRNSYLPIAFAAALIFSTRSPQSIP